MNVTGSIECKSSAVADGVALLDRENEGWWANIDLDTLDINSHRDCVLGQLYGGYNRGREALGIEYGCGDIYGFDTYDRGGSVILNELWVEVITARRATAA